MATKRTEPDGRPSPPPEGEPAAPQPKANGHHVNGKKHALISLSPLESRPGAAVALIDDPLALDTADLLMPSGWLPMAFGTAWDAVDWTPLISRRTVIVPANDPPGAMHAARLETYLRSLGIQATILTLPDALPVGWRMADGLPEGVELFYEREEPGHVPLGEFYTAADLATYVARPVHWIIDGWLSTGLTFLAGSSKIGKSWLALDIAMEVAAGRPVFGKIPTEQCDVLYIALEDHPDRMKGRVDILLGCNVYAENVAFTHSWPTLADNCIERLSGYLDTHPGCRLIFVDIFVLIRGEPEGKKGVYHQDYSDVRPLQKFANDRQVAIVLLHHTRKQEASDAFDKMSGSMGLMGAADNTMILTRRRGEPNGTLTITGRDIKEDGEFAVKFDKESAKWTLIGPAAQVKAETEQGRIYDLLLHGDEPMKGPDIAIELEISLQTVRKSLHRMKARGVVSQVKFGIWGIPGRDYKKAAPREDD